MRAYWGGAHSVFGRIVHLLVLTTLLTGCAMPPLASATLLTPGAILLTKQIRQEQAATLQPYLEKLARLDPTDVVRVIVQYQKEPTALLAQLAKNHGVIVNELALIDALVIDVQAGALPALAADERVRWIALDAPVRKSDVTDGSSGNIRDDFDQISFAGSSGALPWAGAWQEIGEMDGAAAGNVAVVAFWGGALQGLRLQGAQMGAARALLLDRAETLHLGLSFRRKGFMETDYVAMELSRDGGATWQEVTRFAGPVSDAEMQYGDYDLTAYLAQQVTLRFVTAPTMSADAAFYMDAIDVRPTYSAESSAAANQIFLPIIAGAGNAEPNLFAATARSKEEALVTASATQACNYYCFDLSKLASTYVKAIRADQLWNVPPYVRGWGVTVAVVDSGISPHPDLNDYNGHSRIVAQVNFVPNSSVPDDFYGHGTHVAGTIAGLGTSSGGVYMGVAPEARLVDVKVTDDYGMGNTSDVVAGLQWIYNNRNIYNIKVANLSLNSTVPETYHTSALDAALEVLWFNKIVVVVSSGNDGKEKLYPPANDPFAIVVGSTDTKNTVDIGDDKLSSFSAYGMTSDGFNKPDLVAPGQDIVSLLAGDDINLKKVLPLNAILGYANKYFKMSGTSMASAVMSGAVALLLEADPKLTPDQVKYRLLSTARPFAANNSTCATGSGYLDLYAAIYSQSTQSANTGLQASQLLSSGSNPITWGSVSWNSVSWNSVSWNSVSWNSVSWNSVSWNSVSWNSNSNGGGNGNTDCGASFSALTLVNAQTNRDVQPLYENVIIDLDSIGTSYLTVRADPVGPVKSVKFIVNNVYSKIESAAPYALYGDSNGNYGGTTFYPGTYETEVSAYDKTNASGTLLASQKFQAIIISSNYRPRLHSIRSNFCIEGSRGSSNQGIQMKQDGCSGINDEQTFRIKPVAGQKDLVNLVNSSNGFCLDIEGASTGSGAKVIQWSCHGGTNQQFRLKGAGNNAFYLIAVHSGKCLDASNRNLWGGTVTQESCANGNTDQQWRLD